MKKPLAELSVLVVDDEIDILVKHRRLLNEMGVTEMQLAKTPREAMAVADLFEPDHFDLVLTDFLLTDGATGADVVEVCQELRGYTRPPVMIMISGDPYEAGNHPLVEEMLKDDRLEALLEKARDYKKKPDEERLKGELLALMEKHC